MMAISNWYTALVGKRKQHTYQSINQGSEIYGTHDHNTAQYRPDSSVLSEIKRRLVVISSCILVVVFLIYWAVVYVDLWPMHESPEDSIGANGVIELHIRMPLVPATR